MIRFILIILFLIIFFTLTIPIVILDLIIGLFSRHSRDIIAFKFIQAGFNMVLFISGVKVDIQGKDNIPTDTSALYIGNHQGFFDVVIGYTMVPTLTGFIAKKEFLKIPGLNWWMHLGNCLFLDRIDPREGMKTIKKAAELIKNGVSIFIFPEGTRSRTGEIGEFKEGSFKIATKTKCPVVPVAFEGTANAFENQFPRVRPCNIKVKIGEPIYTDKLSREDLKKLGVLTKSAIEEMLNQ